jgi:hypothetical protein
MSAEFLGKFLRISKDIVRADRGMAVDHDLNVVTTFNLSQDVMNSPRFQESAEKALHKAFEDEQVTLTNNIISDPSQAPTTNTNFADLRAVVVIPLGNHGAVYLDQPIRGMVSRETIERLRRFTQHILEEGLEDASETQLAEWYEQM